MRAHRILPGYLRDTDKYFATLVRAISDDVADIEKMNALELRATDGDRAGGVDDAGAALVRVRQAARIVLEIALGEPLEEAAKKLDPPATALSPIDDYATVVRLVAETPLEEKVFGVGEDHLKTFIKDDGALRWLVEWTKMRGRNNAGPRCDLRNDPQKFFREFVRRVVPETPETLDALKKFDSEAATIGLSPNSFSNATNVFREGGLSRNRAPLVKYVQTFALAAQLIEKTGYGTPATDYGELVELEHLRALLMLGTPPGGW